MARFGPKSTKFGSISASVGRFRPNLTDIAETSAETGQLWPKSTEIRPGTVEFGRKQTTCGPNSTRVKFAQNSYSWAEFDRTPAAFDAFPAHRGEIWTDIDRLLPVATEIVSMSTYGPVSPKLGLPPPSRRGHPRARGGTVVDRKGYRIAPCMFVLFCVCFVMPRGPFFGHASSARQVPLFLVVPDRWHCDGPLGDSSPTS